MQDPNAIILLQTMIYCLKHLVHPTLFYSFVVLECCSAVLNHFKPKVNDKYEQ